MSTRINIVDILYMLGDLEDSSTSGSTRVRFIKNYLSKLKSPEEVNSDLERITEIFWEEEIEKRNLLQKAYGDLINRLAEITGFEVEYSKYSNRERITGIWRIGDNPEIRVAAFIPGNGIEAKGISRSALLILPENYELGRPYVTIKNLLDFFDMVVQIDLPLTTISGILTVEDNYDRKLLPVMELILLAFKKKLHKIAPPSLKAEWEKEELLEFLGAKIKEPTRLFILSLVNKKLTAEEIISEINKKLEEKNEREVKSTMAMGALMGTLTKHYSGIKEPLVLRKGKNYFLNEKYRAIISEFKSNSRS